MWNPYNQFHAYATPPWETFVQCDNQELAWFGCSYMPAALRCQKLHTQAAESRGSTVCPPSRSVLSAATRGIACRAMKSCHCTDLCTFFHSRQSREDTGGKSAVIQVASCIHRKKEQRNLGSWVTCTDFREIYADGFSVYGGNICLPAVRRKPGMLLAWELSNSDGKHWWRRDVVPGMLFLQSLSRVGKTWHLKLTKRDFTLTSKARSSEEIF